MIEVTAKTCMLLRIMYLFFSVSIIVRLTRNALKILRTSCQVVLFFNFEESLLVGLRLNIEKVGQVFFVRCSFLLTTLIVTSCSGNS